MSNKRPTSVDAWRDYPSECRGGYRYSVSLCGAEGEIRCLGCADDDDEAWEMAVAAAEEYGVPARLAPYPDGEIARTFLPECETTSE